MNLDQIFNDETTHARPPTWSQYTLPLKCTLSFCRGACRRRRALWRTLNRNTGVPSRRPDTSPDRAAGHSELPIYPGWHKQSSRGRTIQLPEPFMSTHGYRLDRAVGSPRVEGAEDRGRSDILLPLYRVGNGSTFRLPLRCTWVHTICRRRKISLTRSSWPLLH